MKVGWSKKKRKEYEHRAPQRIVEAFVRHLTNTIKIGRTFTMEQILPVPDLVNGGEIPAYQSYLTLAWLNEIGAVVKKGRHIYSAKEETQIYNAVLLSWNSLSVRSK